MAYRIRYGNDKIHKISGLWLKCLISVGVGVVILIGSVISEEVTAKVSSWLVPEQMSTNEMALKSMAQSLSAGEGWYASAVAYCREIMELS